MKLQDDGNNKKLKNKYAAKISGHFFMKDEQVFF